METRTNMGEENQARKFLFDLAFDNGLNKRTDEREKPKPTYSQEQLDDAKRLAYEDGFSSGQKAMSEDQQQYTNVLLTQIDQRLTHILDSSKTIWQKQLAQCQDIALVIARKIMPSYVQANGLGEIESIVAKIIGEMSREPRLVFRINEAQFDDAKTRINAIADQAAYAGKLVILGDPDLGPSDCRIEWADGGIERDVKTLWQDIERVMGEIPSLDELVVETTPEPEISQQQAPPVVMAPTPPPEQPTPTDLGEHQ